MIHLSILLALLITPGMVARRFFGENEFWFLVGGAAVVSGVTYACYAVDKRRAQGGGQRQPESLLHLLELLGGWPGAFLAQQQLRHKCAKAGYQLVFWLIVTLHQAVAVDYLLGWRMARAAWAAVGG